jgi:hypothetical protein
MVTAALASTAAGRKQTQKTRQPTRTRRVSEASAAIVATPSKAGFAGSERSEME